MPLFCILFTALIWAVVVLAFTLLWAVAVVLRHWISRAVRFFVERLHLPPSHLSLDYIIIIIALPMRKGIDVLAIATTVNVVLYPRDS